MTQTIEDRECTENCKSVEHGNLISASLTKRCVSEADLWSFINFLCCCCESVKDSSGRTILHVAASCGKTEIIKYLCQYKHLNLNIRDLESGYTALHRSIFHGKINAVVSLIKLGANVSITDFDGLTVLDHAMYDQKYEITGTDGEIYVWGSNTNYTLGPQQARTVPEIMDIFHKENPSAQVKQVCLSRFHCVILTSDGKIFTSGHGQGGRLGLSTEHAVLTPKEIKFSANSCSSVVFVMASIAQDHSIFLADSGHIWTCGLNTHRVLGFAPPPAQLLTPRVLLHFPTIVHGVIAMKYHTVVWSYHAIFSWGLHGGQLGQNKSEEKYIVAPKQVTNFYSGQSELKMVAGSIGATAVLTSNGDIYVLHEYKCRKIAGKQLDVTQLSIIGGRLDTTKESSVSSDYHPLKVCVLTSVGKVLMWQENDQHLLRCIFSINRLIIVKQISLNINHVLIVTKHGEAFEGIVKERRKRNSEDGTNANKSAFHKFLDKDDCRLVKVTKIPKIHRALSIESDLEGKNFAVIQMNPQFFLTYIPDILPQTIQQDMLKLLQEADEQDGIHDLVFKVDGKIFPVHRFVFSWCELELLDSQNGSSIELSGIHPDIFYQLLLYVYTKSCDLIVNQKCPERLEEVCKMNKPDGKSGEKIKDPVRLLQECAKKLGLRILQKFLENFYYNNGYIKSRNGKTYFPKFIKFNRNSHSHLYDVAIKTKNGKELKAHKCILIARMEYFNNLFSQRWSEVTSNEIHIPYSHCTVEHLLDFLYTDELPLIENEDIENICNLLMLADEYFVERLKQVCEYELSTHINLRNVSQLLTFSNLCNSKQLNKSCMEFICSNLSAVLESRCLENTDEALLNFLTDYYYEWNPILQQRVITPYSTAPNDDFILEIAKNYPFATNDGEIKPPKSVTKKKSKHHKNSTTSKLNDSDKENAVINETSCDVCENVKEVRDINSRESPTAPIRIQAINAALKQIETEPMSTDFTTLGDFASLSNFPELGSPPASAIYSKSPKSSEKFEFKSKAVKLSQKQRKRLSSEGSSKAVPSELPESPKNPWKLCNETSPEGAVLSEAKISVIMTTEKKQKENFSKMLSKPLVYTQKEDKAIEDLYKFYNVENVFDEIITIDRVHLQLVGSPVWVQKNK